MRSRGQESVFIRESEFATIIAVVNLLVPERDFESFIRNQLSEPWPTFCEHTLPISIRAVSPGYSDSTRAGKGENVRIDPGRVNRNSFTWGAGGCPGRDLRPEIIPSSDAGSSCASPLPISRSVRRAAPHRPDRSVGTRPPGRGLLAIAD